MNTAGTSMPPLARWLGFGGLIPFVGLAALVLADAANAVRWSFVLLNYGAVIVSFVGALHWGFAMLWPQPTAALRTRLMVWSVVPALGAWVALLLPTAIGLAVLAGLLVVHFGFDLGLRHFRVLPAWYPRLRSLLTLGAVLSLLAAAVAL